MISGLAAARRVRLGFVVLAMGGLTQLSGCSAESGSSLIEPSFVTLPPVVDQRSGLADRFVGTFTLEAVNGQPLPFVFIDLPNSLNLKQEALGGDIVLGSDGSFTFTSHFRDTQNGVVRDYSDVTTGTYTTTGFDIALLETSALAFAGQLQGNTLTFVYRGFTLQFRRAAGRP